MRSRNSSRPNPGAFAERGGTGEYFLVENRQLVGFDQGLDGCGILVWHIEEGMSENPLEGHTTANHRLVDLEQADGLNQLALATGMGSPAIVAMPVTRTPARRTTGSLPTRRRRRRTSTTRLRPGCECPS